MSGLGWEGLNDIEGFREMFRPEKIEWNAEIPSGLRTGKRNGSARQRRSYRRFGQRLDSFRCVADGTHPCVGLVHDRHEWLGNECGSRGHARRKAARWLLGTLFALVVESSVGVVEMEVV